MRPMRKEPADRLPTRTVVAAAAILALSVVVGMAWARIDGDAADARAQRDAAMTAGEATSALASTLGAELVTLDRLAVRASLGLPLPVRSGFVVRPELVPHPAPDGEGRLAAPEVGEALAVSTDLGTIRLVVVPGDGDNDVDEDGDRGPSVLAVHPLYGRPGEGETVDTTAERRAALTGHLVAGLDLRAALDSIVPAGGTVTLRAVRGPLATAGPAVAGPAVAFVLPVAVADQRWEAVWTLPADGDGLAPAVALGLTIGTAVLVIGLLVIADRRRREVASRAGRAEHRAATISSTADLVQSSLDLADVLPAVLVAMGEDLDLAGSSISIADAEGRLLEVLAIGERPDRTVVPRSVTPPALAPGETLALGLHRGPRLVGVLRILPAAPLRSDELETVQIVVDLVTAAIVNARLFQDQQRAVVRLRELDAMKNVFVGTASHELRTPVTAIVGFANLLRDRWSNLSDEQKLLFLERIGDNALSLDALVADLLDVARLERGELHAEHVPLDLSTTVPAVVDRISGAFSGHQLVCESTGKAIVRGDATGIERIVTNLVSNAAKYSPPNTRIDVRITADGETVKVAVDDQGPGVPPDERERIFSRFYRGDGDHVLRTRGVGIGLAVVAEYVEQLDGTVEVGTSPSGGARFTVRFPLAREEDRVGHAG